MKNSEDIFRAISIQKNLSEITGDIKKYYVYCTVTLLIIAFLINRYSVTAYNNETTVFISKNQENLFFLRPVDVCNELWYVYRSKTSWIMKLKS